MAEGDVLVFKCTNEDCETGQWEVTEHPSTSIAQASVCGGCGKKGKKVPMRDVLTGGQVSDAG